MIDRKAMADIKENPDYKGRVQYFWNGNKNCTLKLSKLIMSDQRDYYARIETDDQKQRFTGTSKVTLSVKGTVAKCQLFIYFISSLFSFTDFSKHF